MNERPLLCGACHGPWHSVQSALRALLAESGVRLRLVWLPGYSPDFMYAAE